MNRLTQIDLNKMDNDSKVFYLRDLVVDLQIAYLNKDGDFTDLLNHATQAVLDLEKSVK
jgi:hypothetical protein